MTWVVHAEHFCEAWMSAPSAKDARLAKTTHRGYQDGEAEVLVSWLGIDLMKKDLNDWQFPWRLFLSELIGTAVLLLGGLSLVIFMFGAGSPMERIVPSIVLRQIFTG